MRNPVRATASWVGGRMLLLLVILASLVAWDAYRDQSFLLTAQIKGLIPDAELVERLDSGRKALMARAREQEKRINDRLRAVPTQAVADIDRRIAAIETEIVERESKRRSSVQKTLALLTGKGFQEDFIDPLFQINRKVFKTKRNLTGEDTSQWTWIGCPHVSKEGQLESLYTGCSPFFFYEGFVTCNDCIEVVPTASLYLQTLLECEAMTDDQLQDRVIDQLYPINRGVLEAVGHYKR